jgi:hypothetical protein
MDRGRNSEGGKVKDKMFLSFIGFLLFIGVLSIVVVVNKHHARQSVPVTIVEPPAFDKEGMIYQSADMDTTTRDMIEKTKELTKYAFCINDSGRVYVVRTDSGTVYDLKARGK